MSDDRPTDAATTDVDQSSSEGADAVRGTVRIAPAVLIHMIELTVNAIDGVVELRPHPKRTRLALELAGKSYDDGKVRVGVIGDRVDTDIAVALRHGVNATEIASSIQLQVSRAVERMLGMSVGSVNVFIDDFQHSSSK